MPLSSAAMAALIQAGATPDMILAAAVAEEALDKVRARETLEAEREQQLRDRLGKKLRKRNQRARDRIASGQPDIAYAIGETKTPSRDVTDVTRDPPFPHTPYPPEAGGDGGGAREALISTQAFVLADQVMDIIGIDREFTPPGWCGTAMFIQSGLNSGWRPEIILIAVEGIAASLRERRAPVPYTFGYLTKPIIRAHGDHQRELPMVRVVSPTEAPYVETTQRQPGGAYGASKDRFRAAHAKLKRHLAETEPDDCGSGGQVVELLSAARRERS